MVSSKGYVILTEDLNQRSQIRVIDLAWLTMRILR